MKAFLARLWANLVSLLPYGLAAIYPIVVYFPVLFPINGRIIIFAGNFMAYQYNYEFYLLDNLSRFRIPLWSPSEGAGFPFYSSPLPQTFYPVNYLWAVFYALAHGFSVVDYAWFSVTGASIFAVGLLLWLRQLRLDWRPALFATLVMSTSMKITDILEIPNSMHTVAWFPWLLFSATHILRSTSLRQALRRSLLLMFIIVSMLTAGWPYGWIYVQFLILPYLMLFAIPQTRYILFGDKDLKWKVALPGLALGVLLAVLLCLPYLWKMYELLSYTPRSIYDFGTVATYYAVDFTDTIGSLIYPPASKAWFYFGIFGVLLIVIYLSSKLWADPDRNASGRPTFAWYHSGRVKACLLLWLAFIIYFSWTSDSLLFRIAWENLPLIHHVRGWGRMWTVLVPILGWLLAVSYSTFEEVLATRPSVRSMAKIAGILAGTMIAIVVTQSYFLSNQIYDDWWASQMSARVPDDRVWIVLGLAALGLIVALLTASRWLRAGNKWVAASALGITVLFSAIDTHGGLRWDVWMQTDPVPQPVPERVELNVPLRNMQSLSLPRYEVASAITPGAYFSVGNAELSGRTWYYNWYVEFLNNTEWELGARRNLLAVTTTTSRFFFSETIAHPTVGDYLADANRHTDVVYNVISYTGDEMLLDVYTSTDGYLSFIDNWDPDWEAYVDGQPVVIERLFNTFKSVFLEAGTHRVQFVYRPKWW